MSHLKSGEKKKMYLALEQHRLELCWSTDTQIFLQYDPWSVKPLDAESQI